MACTSDITSGRERVCKNSLGGNAKLYLYNFVSDPFTVVDEEATGVNPLLTEVFLFELEGDGNTFAENFIGERQNGTSVNTQTLTTILKQQDAVTAFTLKKLVQGYPQAVVEDRNGVFRAIGIDDGIDFTVDASTGGAKTDLNGYTLTGVSTTGELAPILDSATVTAFLALVA